MTDWLAGLLVGLAGTAHCVAMCGHLSATLSLSLPQERQGLIFWVALGKVGLYTLLGAIAGWGGSLLHLAGTHALWAASGIMLVLMGGYGLGLRGPSEQLTRWVAPLVRPAQRMGRRFWPIQTRPQALAWGAMWGLIPCGLVYSALAWSLTAPSIQDGALRMMGMGLGTLPAALGTGWLGQRFGLWSKTGKVGRYSAVLLIIMGAYSFGLAVA